MKRSTRWQHTCLSLLLGGLLAGQSVADQQPLDARASDPNVMGWMQGFPYSFPTNDVKCGNVCEYMVWALFEAGHADLALGLVWSACDGKLKSA